MIEPPAHTAEGSSQRGLALLLWEDLIERSLLIPAYRRSVEDGETSADERRPSRRRRRTFEDPLRMAWPRRVADADLARVEKRWF